MPMLFLVCPVPTVYTSLWGHGNPQRRAFTNDLALPECHW